MKNVTKKLTVLPNLSILFPEVCRTITTLFTEPLLVFEGEAVQNDGQQALKVISTLENVIPATDQV